jgi:hypothetical protein
MEMPAFPLFCLFRSFSEGRPSLRVDTCSFFERRSFLLGGFLLFLDLRPSLLCPILGGSFCEGGERSHNAST